MKRSGKCIKRVEELQNQKGATRKCSIPKLKRSRDESEETDVLPNKKAKIVQKSKLDTNSKAKPVNKTLTEVKDEVKSKANNHKSNRKSKIDFKKITKQKLVEVIDSDNDSDEENSEIESLSDAEVDSTFNNTLNDDDEDMGDCDEEDSDCDEEDSDCDEEGENETDDDDDIAEVINKKVMQSKKSQKKVNNEKDDDNEDDDEDDEENENSDDSSDDSSDDDDDGSSSSSSSEDEEADDIEEIGWTELTANAPRTEDATSRLALCHMDWCHVKAIDLYVVFHSFMPSNGTIKSVKIYQSDFGIERMKIEEEEGPLKLIGHSKDEETQLRNVRKYELEKLKYYYAVIICDSVETADAIYKACDSMEFLNSGVLIDLRFIPEDMTFDRKPTSIAKSMPPESTYKPPHFENKALHHTDVSLTWDDTPVERLNAFKGWEENLDLEEFEARVKDYIAPPSEEEDDEDDDDDDVVVKAPKKRPMKDTIALYRNLLKDIDQKEAEEEEEKKEREETEKKFLEAIGGNMWQTQKEDTSSKNKKSQKVKDDEEDDDEDEEEEEGESGSEMEENDDEDDDDDGEDDDEEDGEESEKEEMELPKKGKTKISNRKLVRMKILEKKKQKNKDSAAPVAQADRFKKLMTNKDFTLDEKVADKTTKLKQRRILSDMKKK